MRRIEWRAFVALASFCLGAAGCATVEPWERGVLAKPQMALDRSPLQSELRSHVYSSREAATGGTSAAGPGCGCY